MLTLYQNRGTIGGKCEPVYVNFTPVEPEDKSVDLISKNVNVSELFSSVFTVFLPFSQSQK